MLTLGNSVLWASLSLPAAAEFAKPIKILKREDIY